MEHTAAVRPYFSVGVWYALDNDITTQRMINTWRYVFIHHDPLVNLSVYETILTIQIQGFHKKSQAKMAMAHGHTWQCSLRPVLKMGMTLSHA